jgi:cytochrome P450/NADPH-cytochrome P450 reductase
MTPTIPIRSTTPKEDTTLANGRYAVKAGTNILIIHQTAQTDPAAWGEDVSVSVYQQLATNRGYIYQAEEFKPERMMDGKFEKLPVRSHLSIIHKWLLISILKPNAWQPFGETPSFLLVHTSTHHDYAAQAMV